MIEKRAFCTASSKWQREQVPQGMKCSSDLDMPCKHLCRAAPSPACMTSGTGTNAILQVCVAAAAEPLTMASCLAATRARNMFHLPIGLISLECTCAMLAKEA